EPAKTSETPVLWVGGFADFNAREPVYQSMFNSLSGPRWGFFGPWGHGAGTGPNGEDFDQLTLDWFDHWTKGRPLASTPRVLVQEIDGHWRSESSWPPSDATPQSIPLAPGSYFDLGANAEETAPP